MRGPLLTIAVVLVVLVAAAAGSYFWFARKAPTPAAFDESVTLEQASAAAAADDEVVLALVTADFCPVCQIYKRNALAGERFASWAQENAATVYLEWERNKDVIDRIGVEKWPATVVMKPDGDILALEYGMMSEDELIAFLDSAADASSPDASTGEPGPPAAEAAGGAERDAA